MCTLFIPAVIATACGNQGLILQGSENGGLSPSKTFTHLLLFKCMSSLIDLHWTTHILKVKLMLTSLSGFGPDCLAPHRSEPELQSSSWFYIALLQGMSTGGIVFSSG